MLKLGNTVLGVDDMERATAFWTAALSLHPRHEPDDDWVILVDDEDRGPALALSKTRATVSLPPRMHLDLYADDQAAEIERLLGLGARHIDYDRYPENADYVILEDTEGNRFCVVDLNA
jgi:catechol 2,3-dioxygenase-like lactoylglutathione lyase family enzyme